MSLEGPIKVGDRLIWEPDKPWAYAVVEVVKVHINQDGECWIETRDRNGFQNWNEESRIREACIRINQ